jgi:exosortase A-associated hydrolase 1
VLIIVGGPQYRTGSHRQFVHLARALAAAGHPVLRFDYRGLGDSTGELRNFEHCSADIDCAVVALQAARPGVQRVVLWGLCDAASAALLYLQANADARVAGLALANPWVRSAASLARTHVKHYYLRRLREREFWRKFLRGGVALTALRGLVSNLRAVLAPRHPARHSQAPYQQRMAAAWADFSGSILLMLSEDDYTAREFEEVAAGDAAWQHALRRRAPQRVLLAGADHTCSTPGAQAAAEAATVAWLHDLSARELARQRS